MMPHSGPQAIRRAAFRLLLADGRPAAVASLATRVGLETADAEAMVQGLDRQGLIRRHADGSIVGACGLSLVPTQHAITLDGRRFWTWCAFDAVSILAAVGGGILWTTSPASGRALELRVEAGQPVDERMAIFLASQIACRSLVEEWCPLNNLFESVELARQWGVAAKIEGTTLPVREAASLGAEKWRSLLTAEQQAEPA
jgi:Alkylmercury lyase